MYVGYDIVAVHHVHVPAEGTPAVFHGRERQDVLRVTERLLPVQVDDGDQVRQPVVGREHHRLPEGALVALGIADERESPPPRPLQLGRQRGAGRDRQPLPERAGREVDPSQGAFGVDAEQRFVGAVGVELLLGQPAPQEQRRVDREDRVAFADDETVAVRIIGVQPRKDPSVERRNDVGDRQRRADVPDVRPLRLLEDDAPDAGGRDRPGFR